MKRFKKTFLFILLAGGMLVTSCNGNKPRTILSQEKMQDVMWDVAMAGEFANGYVYNQNPMENRVSVNEALLNEIYRLHGITKNEFEKSLAYYKKRPKIFMAILDSITAKQTGIRPGLQNSQPSISSPNQPGIVSPPPVHEGSIPNVQ